MPRARFRLHSATLEGFKGFTETQTITFSGKHAFLFGKNGSGKSSIVEAIRWCLFGLAERRETEVLNAYYAPGECQVDLALQSSEGLWHVRRRLRPGAERSRLTITNPEGQEVLQSQVFPYLARMGPKEGTHVIFAAQQATGRRPQADVSNFHKVLYLYLHLEDVPDLLERLDKILEEQNSAREDVASEIGEIEDSLREKLAQVTLSLNELLRNPPWAQSGIPTQAETETTINSFAFEVARLVNESLATGILASEALEKAEQWCQKLANTDREEQRKKRDEQRSKGITLRTHLQTLDEAEKSQGETVANITEIEKELVSVLGGQSLEDIKAKIGLLKKKMLESSAKLAIAKSAQEYFESYSPAECPVCLTKCDAEELREKVKVGIDQGTPEQIGLVREVESLQNIHQRAVELSNRLINSKTLVQTAQEKHTNTMLKIRTLLGLSGDSSLDKENIKAHLSSIESSVRTLEENLESTESHHAERRKRVEALRGELRFHKYRDEQQKLQKRLTIGLEPIREQLRELVELENTVHNIRETLGQAFNEAIDRALPHLNSMMTQVYQRLTGQKSFEKMYVQRVNVDGGRNLEVRVGSERIPGQLFNPDDVLNGQANSALRLVPYFVFSQFQAESLELDLLLIDDPSQSFDTSRIDSLLQELANAGSHAQLIIATHEDERFNPQIDRYFASGEYEVIRFAEFDVKKGPCFAIQ